MSTQETNKKCLKCNYIRNEGDNLTPDYECPSCKAIYSKVEKAMGISTKPEDKVKESEANQTGKVELKVKGIEPQKKIRIKKTKIQKKSLLLLIPIFLLGLTYFLPGKINGNIFIVTRGSNTIELSNIRVFAVKKDDFYKHMLSKKSDFNNCPTASDELRYLDSVLSATKKRKSKWHIDNLKDDHVEKNRANHKCIYDLTTEILHQKTNIISSTRTESNGLFELSVPRHKDIMIIVRASRKLPLGGHEEYLWDLPENLGFKFSSSIQLSNHNLADPKRLDSFVASLY
jgi:hypothetical protein